MNPMPSLLLAGCDDHDDVELRRLLSLSLSLSKFDDASSCNGSVDTANLHSIISRPGRSRSRERMATADQLDRSGSDKSFDQERSLNGGSPVAMAVYPPPPPQQQQQQQLLHPPPPPPPRGRSSVRRPPSPLKPCDRKGVAQAVLRALSVERSRDRARSLSAGRSLSRLNVSEQQQQQPPSSYADTSQAESCKSLFDDSFASLSSSFAPRPVRVTQFDDKMDDEQQHSVSGGGSLSKLRVKATTTATTESFVSSMRDVNDESLGQPTPNVDWRGRCVRHPYIKLRKKKLLGSTEVLHETCPTCLEEAHYRHLWRGRARRRPSAAGKPQFNARQQLPQERAMEQGPPSSPFNDGSSLSEPSQQYCRLMQKAQERRRSRSRGRGRSKSKERRRSKSRECRRSKSNERILRPRSRSKEAQAVRRALSVERARSLSAGRCRTTRHELQASFSSCADTAPITSDDEPLGSPSQHSLGRNSTSPPAPEFDRKSGRCKKHPSVIVAKKSAFQKNKWDVVKKCPFCSEDEDSGSEEHQSRVADRTIATDLSLPERRRKSPGRAVASSAARSPLEEGRLVVSRMPYTIPRGDSGWYSGEVDPHGRPHGQGRMRCRTGNTIEGEWMNGCPEDHQNLGQRMRSGFGTNVAPWKECARLLLPSSAPSPGNGASSSRSPSKSQYQDRVQYSAHSGMAPSSHSPGNFVQSQDYYHKRSSY